MNQTESTKFFYKFTLKSRISTEKEEDDDLADYDPIHDPNLDDFDPAEIQESRQAGNNDTYWLFDSFRVLTTATITNTCSKFLLFFSVDFAKSETYFWIRVFFRNILILRKKN